MMRHLETNGIGSALRMLYRPVAMFSDAFDFLTGEDAPDVEEPDATSRAIADMRSAAQRLNSVASVVITTAEPTARQVILSATDEAAEFDA